jgi:YidC/Oxa1 family membrane protein insertase
MDQLFHEAQTEAKTEGDDWFVDAATATANTWEPTWYNFADQAVNAVQTLHEMTGLHYAGSIVATTCAIRLLVLPIAIRSQRAGSRMAHLQPELAVLKKRYEALGTPTQAEQRAFGEQMKSLFAKYEVGPFQTMAAPLLQIPLFIGMFFGMKKMPDIFTSEMSTGGLAWFTDLTVPDPTYVLPIICGISFLATIEGGKEQMMDANPAMGATLVNAFRAMVRIALLLVPIEVFLRLLVLLCVCWVSILRLQMYALPCKSTDLCFIQ